MLIVASIYRILVSHSYLFRPRYLLLLSEIIKATVKKHPDYKNLRLAYDAIYDVVEYINDQKRIFENTEKILRVQEMINGKLVRYFFNTNLASLKN